MATHLIKKSKAKRRSKSKREVPTVVAAPRRFSKARPLAERLGVSTKTIHRWGCAGLIHPRKLGARTELYDEQEVEAFIESARVAVSAHES
jgi:predicted DNA-binding transcriptional regulator AlpA